MKKISYRWPYPSTPRAREGRETRTVHSSRSIATGGTARIPTSHESKGSLALCAIEQAMSGTGECYQRTNDESPNLCDGLRP